MAAPGTTIIIKKIKKGGHGHHGGAWKVAYADFVTAMMAFFLLLWLLTATPVENLKGLADYFSPTLGLQGKLGIGFAGGRSPDSEGRSQGNWASMGLIFGSPPSGPIIKFPDQDNKTDEDNQKVEFGKAKDEVSKSIKESPELSEYQDNVQIEQTPEGLRINITDTENRPMFKQGSAELEPSSRKILGKIANLVKDIPNYLQISGSTNSLTNAKDESYTNWELSADRANAARRYLIKVGVESLQIARVVALADQEPLEAKAPEAPQNNRVTITLLRKTLLAYNRQPAPEDVIMGPIEAGLQTYLKDQKRREEEDKKFEPEPETIEPVDPSKPVEETKHFSDDDIDDGSGKEKRKKKEKKKGDPAKPKMKKKKAKKPSG
jgi:chemotaxis protein MotB